MEFEISGFGSCTSDRAIVEVGLDGLANADDVNFAGSTGCDRLLTVTFVTPDDTLSPEALPTRAFRSDPAFIWPY